MLFWSWVYGSALHRIGCVTSQAQTIFSSIRVPSWPFTVLSFYVSICCTDGILICSCSISALKYLEAKKKNTSHKNPPHVMGDPFLVPSSSDVRYSTLIIWDVSLLEFCSVACTVPGLKGQTWWSCYGSVLSNPRDLLWPLRGWLISFGVQSQYNFLAPSEIGYNDWGRAPYSRLTRENILVTFGPWIENSEKWNTKQNAKVIFLSIFKLNVIVLNYMLRY